MFSKRTRNIKIKLLHMILRVTTITLKRPIRVQARQLLQLIDRGVMELQLNQKIGIATCLQLRRPNQLLRMGTPTPTGPLAITLLVSKLEIIHDNITDNIPKRFNVWKSRNKNPFSIFKIYTSQAHLHLL